LRIGPAVHDQPRLVEPIDASGQLIKHEPQTDKEGRGGIELFTGIQKSKRWRVEYSCRGVEELN